MNGRATSGSTPAQITINRFVLHTGLMTSTSWTCELSVVVGSIDAADSIQRCLQALALSCRGIDAEILVVDASRDGTAELARAALPGITVWTLPHDTLVPVLWGAGLRAARGRVVAFTIPECVVEPTWARAMLDGVAAGAAGVGGPIALAPGADATTRATFYLRYSSWLGRRAGAADEIAGDNAGYDHDALLAARDRLADGFWEIDVHARFRELGKHLVMDDRATASFARGPSLAVMAGRRFAHGRHSGDYRVRQGIRPRWQVVVGGPLVPAVLFLRVARRVANTPTHWSSFLTAAGAFLVLATAWALGEMMGGLTAVPNTRHSLRAA